MTIELLGNTLSSIFFNREKLVSMRLCAFACSLYLTGIVLSWFSSLAPNSIQFWNQLECELHGHFFNMHNKGKLSDLTSVKQGRDEIVLDYF